MYPVVRILVLIQMFWLGMRFARRGKRLYIKRPFTIVNPQFIECGDFLRIQSGARIECVKDFLNTKFSPRIRIGNNVSIGRDVHIGVVNSLVIEDNVLIGSKVLISDHNHGMYGVGGDSPLTPPGHRELHSPGAIIIRQNVWIGEGVCILPNVTIGEGAVVGANSVVTTNIPSNCIVAGNPANIKKSYNVTSGAWSNST
jgi:acetyltransferase-like isoleucine patch superfamily enzyme